MAAEQAHIDEPVRLVPYEHCWPLRFLLERTLLEDALGAAVTGGIHHVGSTAVPRLEAKPTIDILVGVCDLVSARECFGRLCALGYVYAPYLPEEMHWFCKPSPARRTYHLHLVPSGSRRYVEELAFRDLLRTRQIIAAEYVAVKRHLAADHTHDREAYTDGKRAFIARVLADSCSAT